MNLTITRHAFPDLTVAVQDGLAYPLTTCCQASGKGGERGVICRACYRDVDDLFGDCVVLAADCVDRIASWTDAPKADVEALVASWRAAGLA